MPPFLRLRSGRQGVDVSCDLPAVRVKKKQTKTKVKSIGILLPTENLVDLMIAIGAAEKIEKDGATQIIQQHMEEFIDEVLDYSCKMARRRNATRLNAADISLALDCLWNIDIPGYTIRKVIPQFRAHPDHEKRQAAVNATRNRFDED